MIQIWLGLTGYFFSSLLVVDFGDSILGHSYICRTVFLIVSRNVVFLN